MPFRYEKFLEDLVHLVESGEIQMARINDAVERILRVKFIAGLFEYPLSDRSLLDFVGCKVSLSSHICESFLCCFWYFLYMAFCLSYPNLVGTRL